jgi:PAS domain S-box-containing protein
MHLCLKPSSCFLADEVTPWPPEDLPLVRAIRGEAVVDAEIFVRHDRLSEGIWLCVNAQPLLAEGTVCGGVAVFRDITTTMKASRRRAALFSVSRVLGESPSLREAAPQLLQALGESTGWDLGNIWDVDRRLGLLYCAATWQRPGIPMTELATISRQIAFPRCIGLPGQVWARRQSTWIGDLATDGLWPRASVAEQAGLRSAFLFPILFPHGEVAGVIEFFSRFSASPDDELMAMFTSLGSQIGQFIQRKQAEDELRRSRERFETAVQGTGDGLWDWDVESNEIYFSPRWKALLGYEEGEISNSFGEWVERIHPEDLDRVLKTLEAYIDDSQLATFELEHRLRHKNGSYRWILARGVALRDASGQPYRLAGSHSDITSRKQIEEALRDSEALYHSLVETLPLNMFRKDLQGRITFGNRLYCSTLRRSLKELLGKTDYDLFPPELARKYRNDDEIVSSTGQLFQTIEEHVLPSGEKIYVQVLKTPVYDARGQVVGTQGIFWDVTAQTLAAEAQKKAVAAAEAANRAKSEFLANMSHEIRTPMNAIVGMTELVLKTSLNAEQREYLQMARESADSLMKIINDILDFSKIEAGKLELDRVPFDLRDHLGDTLKALAVQAHASGLELACRVAPGVPEVIVADPHRLRQVLVNLIGNAIKFTEHGEVVVEVEVRARRAGEMALQFAVSDTGIGIAPDHVDLIFEPFSQVDGSMTRKYSGTGLGLAISRQLVEMLGGHLMVQSTPGQGSRFHFTAWFEVTRERPAPPLDPAQVHGLSVLIVDDNATNRRILEEMLLSWEMRPNAVASGEEAIAALWQAYQAGTPFALILLDAQMPGVDGFSLAAYIRAQRELVGATIMMLSSTGHPASLASLRELGIAGYLTKPIKQADLGQAILVALGTASDDRGRIPFLVETASHRPATQPRPLRILLAEDNVFNQKLAIGLLEKEGHTVVLASNGVEAVAAAEREPLDLVLMDVQMPEMDGFEATRAIRRREAVTGGHVAILAMTAHAMKGDRERCLQAGMDEYISKPVRAQDLFEAIARLTRSAPSCPAPQVADQPATAEGPNWDEALEHVAGDHQLLRELVGLFLQECSGWMNQIRAGVTGGNPVEAHFSAHKLKNCLGNFAAWNAFEAAKHVEELARKGALKGAEQPCRALEETLESLRPILITFLASVEQGSELVKKPTVCYTTGG